MSANIKTLERLRVAALACKGWHWPDRNRGKHGEHQFGQRNQDGEFSEIGSIDASAYTGEYADDIRVLKFIRAAQPETILALVDEVAGLRAALAKAEATMREVANGSVFAEMASRVRSAEHRATCAMYREDPQALELSNFALLEQVGKLQSALAVAAAQNKPVGAGDERAAFEVALLDMGFPPNAIERDEKGIYYQMDVRMVRKGWVAGRAQSAKQIATLHAVSGELTAERGVSRVVDSAKALDKWFYPNGCQYGMQAARDSALTLRASIRALAAAPAAPGETA